MKSCVVNEIRKYGIYLEVMPAGFGASQLFVIMGKTSKPSGFWKNC